MKGLIKPIIIDFIAKAIGKALDFLSKKLDKKGQSEE